MTKPGSRQRQRDNAAWQTDLDSAVATLRGASPETHEFFLDIGFRVCQFGDQHQVPPEDMVALLAMIIGTLAAVQVDGETRNDRELDAFVSRCHAALHVGIASARITAGQIRPDA